MILQNAENCFQVWIFREREFTDPLLFGSIFEDCLDLRTSTNNKISKEEK